jgi:hypothetical protein
LDIILGYLNFELLTTALREGLLLLDNLNIAGRGRDTTSVDFKVFDLDPIQLLIQILF